MKLLLKLAFTLTFLVIFTNVQSQRSLAELQQELVNTRYQAYFHYNMCTFLNLNEEKHIGRSTGQEPASMFAPTGLDTKQWAEVCKLAKMEGGWLTTKHHGGFCLWNSAFTDYDVASSGDTTDIVREFTQAFRDAGLKVGLYYSILDYHHDINNGVTSANDVQFMKNQITELLTNYGKIDYMNFDGWSTWPTTPSFDDINYGEILALVKELQPECLIVSHTYESNLAHAEVPFADAAGRNYPYHPEYLRPTAASDFLQIDWWWDDNNNMRVRKSVEYILGKLDSYNSHNSVYILNISPNPAGEIDQDAIDRLKEVADIWEKPADIPMGDNWGYQYDTKKNLAFMKPCIQSSTHDYIRDKRAYPRAEIAVDGVTEGNSQMEQTSWTLDENQPWWRVDLGANYSINEITIFNRTDASKESLSNYTLSILDAAGNVVWNNTQQKYPDPSSQISVPDIDGRFVKIQLNKQGELTIAEVIVKGKIAPLVAGDIYVSPEGGLNNTGTKNDPLSFEAAINLASKQLKEQGLPDKGIHIHVLGGLYRLDNPFILGDEFQGTSDNPIIISAEDGEEVIFDGSRPIPFEGFSKVVDREEKKRLAKSAAKHILVSTITDETIIARFKEKLMLNLNFNGQGYLPSVFPNEGYSNFKIKPVTPEICPPGIPIGEQDYGIRAGSPPHQEAGKAQGWKGTLDEPRGAIAGISEKENEMGGSWTQWENELKRNNTRNQVTGYIEANWLLSSQPMYAASGEDKCIHLSRALGYGWAWRNKDKPFRVFGLLCEVDKPGEWHFDPLTNRLYIYPIESENKDLDVALSIAQGFIHLENSSHVHILGLSVKSVAAGNIYRLEGHHNLIASCTVSSSTATGVSIGGTYNRVEGCDFIDLNSHVRLSGGHRSPTEIIAGHNIVQNCHIYQKQFKHEKVNIGMSGVGNVFRNNLVHNSLGQAMMVNGNDHLIELNEFFNVGYDEGDGGAIYSGGDLTGYGIVYRYNFFHHLMHVPGKVERSGIHLDDGQSGATCIGNVFYKSAAKGLFAFGGAANTFMDNIFLEGYRGIYINESLGKKSYDIHKGIAQDPDHMYKNTKENYIGRAEKIVGKEGWANSPWREKYPLFNEVMSDTAMYGRLWPIHYRIENNYFYNNSKGNKTIKKASPEAWAKNIVKDEKLISPDDFVDYENLDFRFKNQKGTPKIPFGKIGLYEDKYRLSMPDKSKYRIAIKNFFEGIGSMPGTTKRIDTSELVER